VFEANSDDLDASKSAEFDQNNDNADNLDSGVGLEEQGWDGKDNDDSAAASAGDEDAIAGNGKRSSEESLKSRTLKSLKLPDELLNCARRETSCSMSMLADAAT
jgi:hypothetical protein